MSRQKKNYSAEFKAQVVLELLRGDTTLNELAERYQIAPATLSAWHRVFQERAQTVFQQGPTAQDKEITCQNVEIEALQKKVGQLTIECAPLRGQAGSKKILRSLWPPRSAPHSFSGLKLEFASSVNVSWLRRIAAACTAATRRRGRSCRMARTRQTCL